jgi:hypothetical protein
LKRLKGGVPLCLPEGSLVAEYGYRNKIRVLNRSGVDESHRPIISKTNGIPEEEIKIIGAIRSSGPNDQLTARQVADDVGCYVEKVAKFGDKLDRGEIIDRQKMESIGKHIYFNPDPEPARTES